VEVPTKEVTMTEQHHYTPQEGRAANMNLGPNSHVPDSEVERERDVAASVNPGPHTSLPDREVQRQHDVASVISPGSRPPSATTVPDEAPGSRRHGQGPTPADVDAEQPTPPMPLDTEARRTIEAEKAEGAKRV